MTEGNSTLRGIGDLARDYLRATDGLDCSCHLSVGQSCIHSEAWAAVRDRWQARCTELSPANPGNLLALATVVVAALDE